MLGENVAASRKASVESNRVRDQTIDCPIDGTLSLHRRKHTWTVFFDEASDLKGRVSDYSTIGIPHRKDEFLRQKLLAGGTSLSCRTEREKLLLLYRGSFDRRCGAFSIARNQFFDDDNDFSGDENCEMTSAEQYPSSDEFARCNNRRRNARERERERERETRGTGTVRTCSRAGRTMGAVPLLAGLNIIISVAATPACLHARAHGRVMSYVCVRVYVSTWKNRHLGDVRRQPVPLRSSPHIFSRLAAPLVTGIKCEQTECLLLCTRSRSLYY